MQREGLARGLRVGSGLVPQPVVFDNVLSEIEVHHLVALVQDDEKEVETGQDGGGDVHVLPQSLGAVVAAVEGVGGGEHTRAGVECGLGREMKIELKTNNV